MYRGNDPARSHLTRSVQKSFRSSIGSSLHLEQLAGQPIARHVASESERQLTHSRAQCLTALFHPPPYFKESVECALLCCQRLQGNSGRGD